MQEGNRMNFHAYLEGKRLYFVGIKGTGMSSLAVMLTEAGVHVEGSDSIEVFQTDWILSSQTIHIDDWSTTAELPDYIDIVVYSAACSFATHVQIRQAVEKGLPVYSYPQFLALLTRISTCYGIAGTHGKTTSTGCVSHMLQHTGLPYYAIYGATRQQEKPSYYYGDEIGIIESCEYRDHFLSYELKGALVTTIDYDHPDFFATEQEVERSFWQFASRIARGGFLIICTDSDATSALALRMQQSCPQVTTITYGKHSDMFRLYDYSYETNQSFYKLAPLEGIFSSRLAGIPLCLDIVGAALLSACILLFDNKNVDVEVLKRDGILSAMLREGERFLGCTTRSEIMGTDDQITFINDYAHHPTEIKITLEALRLHYPESRIIVIFSPHTVSRTKAFFNGFVQSLSCADLLFIRNVAPSARDDGDVTLCQTLADSLAHTANALYIPDDDVLVRRLSGELHSGDVCVTMGAGNTTSLIQRLVALFRRSAE